MLPHPAVVALAVPTTLGANMTDVWYWVMTNDAPMTPIASRKRRVDVGQRIVNALGLLLRASRGEDHCRAGVAEESRRLHNLLLRDSRDALCAVRPVGDRAGLYQVEADGALCYVLLVDQTFLDEHVENAVCQGGVCPGRELQVEVGSLGRNGRSRVYDNQGSAG